MCLDGQLNPEFTMYYMHIHVGMCSDGQLNSKSIMDYMHYTTVFNGSLPYAYYDWYLFYAFHDKAPCYMWLYII